MVLRFLSDIFAGIWLRWFCGFLVEVSVAGVITTGVLWVAGVVNVLRRV